MAPPVVFEITITNGDRAFNPGCFVTGKVVIQTTRRKKLVAIRLFMNGNSYVNPRRGESDSVYERQVIVGRHLECEVNLWGGNGGLRLLEPGYYSFPFAVKLPQISLPTSFESSAGAIRYWLEARIDKRARSYITKKAFIIQERMDLNVGRQNLFLSKSGESRRTFRAFSGRSGPLILAASTDRGGYCPGENILVTAYLDNRSNKGIKKVKATLLCRMTYFRQYQSHVVDTLVAQLRMCHPISAGRHAVWDHHPLPIPAAILPSSHTSSIIHTDYMLVVKASTPTLSEDVCVTLPIVIGTEPLRPRWGSVGHNLPVYPHTLGSTVRPGSWGRLRSYSLQPVSSVRPPGSVALLEPSEPPPVYTPHPTSVVGPSTHSLRPVSADPPSMAQPQGSLLAASNTTQPQVSLTDPLNSASPQVPSSDTLNATPPQVSSPDTPNVTPNVTPSQVSSSASQDSAPPQVSSPASQNSAPPQVSSPDTPNVTPPQVSSSASQDSTPTQVFPSASQESAPLQVSSPASQESAPLQVSSPASQESAPLQVSPPDTPNVTPTQVSSSASQDSTPTQVSPPASQESAPLQVSPPDTPNVTPPQVSSSASQESAPPQVSSPASRDSSPIQVSPPASQESAPPQVSPPDTPNVTPTQVSLPASRDSSPTEVSPPASQESAPPQVSSPASRDSSPTEVSPPASQESAPLQVSMAASPNVTTPQVSLTESRSTTPHPVSSLASLNGTLSLAPQVIRAPPQVSSDSPQVVLESPPVSPERPRRSKTSSGRRRPRNRSAGYNVLVNAN